MPRLSGGYQVGIPFKIRRDTRTAIAHLRQFTQEAGRTFWFKGFEFEFQTEDIGLWNFVSVKSPDLIFGHMILNLDTQEVTAVARDFLGLENEALEAAISEIKRQSQELELPELLEQKPQPRTNVVPGPITQQQSIPESAKPEPTASSPRINNHKMIRKFELLEDRFTFLTRVTEYIEAHQNQKPDVGIDIHFGRVFSTIESAEQLSFQINATVVTDTNAEGKYENIEPAISFHIKVKGRERKEVRGAHRPLSGRVAFDVADVWIERLEIVAGCTNSAIYAYFRELLSALSTTYPEMRKIPGMTSISASVPSELQISLDRFLVDHPDGQYCAFIMMKYENTDVHNRILHSVRETCKKLGIAGLRADDKEYAPELLPNVRTYMHGCGLGIAIFDRLTSDDFNPNVSLEVGYMMALGRPVCLLKDATLTSLHSDIVGRLYRRFDTQHPEDTIPPELEKWMRDYNIIGA
jgi:hypothetical protein